MTGGLFGIIIPSSFLHFWEYHWVWLCWSMVLGHQCFATSSEWSHHELANLGLLCRWFTKRVIIVYYNTLIPAQLNSHKQPRKNRRENCRESNGRQGQGLSCFVPAWIEVNWDELLGWEWNQWNPKTPTESLALSGSGCNLYRNFSRPSPEKDEKGGRIRDGRCVFGWVKKHSNVFPSYKPSFTWDFPLPCLITGGYVDFNCGAWRLAGHVFFWPKGFQTHMELERSQLSRLNDSPCGQRLWCRRHDDARGIKFWWHGVS